MNSYKSHCIWYKIISPYRSKTFAITDDSEKYVEQMNMPCLSGQGQIKVTKCRSMYTSLVLGHAGFIFETNYRRIWVGILFMWSDLILGPLLVNRMQNKESSSKPLIVAYKYLTTRKPKCFAPYLCLYTSAVKTKQSNPEKMFLKLSYSYSVQNQKFISTIVPEVFLFPVFNYQILIVTLVTTLITFHDF